MEEGVTAVGILVDFHASCIGSCDVRVLRLLMDTWQCRCGHLHPIRCAGRLLQ